MPRKSDYAARVARAQAAGYSSLSAQRTAQAHARGYTSRAAEIAARKQPTVDNVIQHMQDIGVLKGTGQHASLRRRLTRQTYRKLNDKMNVTDRAEWMSHLIDDDDDSFFYH